jgi:TonB family protein
MSGPPPGTILATVEAMIRPISALGVLLACLSLPPVTGAAMVQSAASFVTSGEAKFAAGDTAGAVADFTRAIALDPKNELAYKDRGFLRLQQADRPGAIDDFTQAVNINPANGEYYGLRGMARQAAGDAAGARVDFTASAAAFARVANRTATSVDPGDRRAYGTALAGLAAMYRPDRLNDLVRLEPVLQALIALDPTSPAGYRDLVDLYDRRVEPRKAIDTLWDRAAHEVGPHDEAFVEIARRYVDEAIRAPGQAEKHGYALQGLDAVDRALAANSTAWQVLTVKAELLRIEAGVEPDRQKQADLLAEAQAVMNRAQAVRPIGAPPIPEPPLPPIAPNPVGSAPVRVGEKIPAPAKIKDAAPVYPALAKAARLEGVVVLDATIAPDGRVIDVKVLQTPDTRLPILGPAAVDAVKQWQYSPTMIDGHAVTVVLTVTVVFSLK